MLLQRCEELQDSWVRALRPSLPLLRLFCGDGKSTGSAFEPVTEHSCQPSLGEGGSVAKPVAMNTL